MNNEGSDLKNAWISQLLKEWERANFFYFNSQMHPPDIELSSNESTLGSWEGGRKRRLCVSTRLVEKQKWQYTQEVLYHEMVHQYIEEVLHITDAPPHGELFKKICSLHSIDPLLDGPVDQWLNRPTGKEHSEHRRLNKVQKLFSLAQSDNQHEAELAMAKARELLLRHNLSLSSSNPEYTYRQVGELGRKSAIKSLVAGIISEFFFVKTIWAFGYDPSKNQSGRILELFGREENVAIAEYVYSYLLSIVEHLWKSHKAARGLKQNKNRKTFIYGLLHGFHEKLSEESKTASLEKGLVWVEDASLLDYYEKKRPRTKKSTINCTSACGDTYRSGISRGKRIVINKGIAKEKYANKLLGGRVPIDL